MCEKGGILIGSEERKAENWGERGRRQKERNYAA